MAGLVLCRDCGGNVSIPVISGTSVQQADIDGLTDELEALELLYLLRQEIFISEGRRFVDLCLKMPISENEQLTNELVSANDILSFVPAFIPTDMDAFTYDPATGEVTITHNMNEVLVTNRADPSVIPFF